MQMQEGIADQAVEPVGHYQKRQAVGEQPILMPKVLTTSLAAETEIVTSCWTDLVLWRAS